MSSEVREPSAKYLVWTQSNNDGAGIPPSGWQIKPLGELSAFITSGSRGWASYYKEHGATFIRSQNVLKGQLDFSDHQCVVPPVGSEGSRTRVEFGDLLITITGNSVGNVAYVDRPLGEAYISQHVGLVRLKDSESAAYICRFLSPGAPGNAQIVSNQSGQSKPGLNLKNLRDFAVSIPPKEEQLAIAAALSDVDALIAGLEKLIAKKRDLKQAAMQQLLTGQTRLPGFRGEWVVKRLGDLANVAKGRGLSKGQLAGSGANPCILYGELFTTYERVISSVVSKTNSSEGLAGLRGDVLLPGSTTTKAIDLAVACALLADDVQLGGDINVVRMKSASSYDPIFMANLLTHTQKLAIADLAQGSTIIHLYGRALLNLKLKLPVITEQAAIATVLSDMDTEITSLESRLAKIHDLKQGMMQELLTGRTRLV